MNTLHSLWRVIGPTTAYRLGRFLYMQARGDVANDILTNGELMVQRRVIEAVQRSANQTLVCFDVGANIGDWSSAFLKECQKQQLRARERTLYTPIVWTASLAHYLSKRPP